MSRVVAEVRRFLDRHGPAGAGWVVAVSGGADSVALLRAMLEAGAGPVVVAHYNHQLRGAESNADEAFVRGLVESLRERGHGIGFACETRPVAAVAREAGRNLEAVAREMRYEWVGSIAGPAGWIATGHTADDQAETVLHRLIRGTGVQGLRGIAAVRHFPPSPRAGEGPGVRGGASGNTEASPLTPNPSPARGEGNKIVRPLLTATRAEVLDYLASLGQPYRTDSSNADVRFTRNRIRHELLPLLKSFNPEIVPILGRLAAQAEEVFGQLEADARDLLAAAELPRAGGVLVFDAGVLEAAPPHRVRDALRLAWGREGWPADGMTFAHWDRLAGIARGDPPAADFPGGVTARRVGRVVQLGRHP